MIFYTVYFAIELTANFLEKFGFEKNITVTEEIVGFRGRNNETSIMRDITYVRWSKKHFVLKEEGASFFYKNIKVESVHQLQNMFFALKGEELEVKQLQES
jgi:hypothetical protein